MEENQQKNSHAPLLAHLVELRARLLWAALVMAAATGVCYLFVDDLYEFLVAPLARAMGPGDSNRLIYTGLTEAFFTGMQLSFFAGIFIAFPFLLWQIWRFVAPGLYEKERKTFWPFLIATPVLFYMGGAVAYYVMIPFAWKFFLSFQTSGAETALPIRMEARVSEYLALTMQLIFAFGACFQMPVVMALLAKGGFITAQSLRKYRRYAIIVIFIVAAIFTPPDVLSQTLLAVPLLILYEVSILVVRHVTKPARDL